MALEQQELVVVEAVYFVHQQLTQEQEDLVVEEMVLEV